MGKSYHNQLTLFELGFNICIKFNTEKSDRVLKKGLRCVMILLITVRLTVQASPQGTASRCSRCPIFLGCLRRSPRFDLVTALYANRPCAAMYIEDDGPPPLQHKKACFVSMGTREIEAEAYRNTLDEIGAATEMNNARDLESKA